MKKILLVILTLSLLVGIVFAQEMIPTPDNKKAMETPVPKKIIPSERTAPVYTFTKTPHSLLTSYYDYMIGSYNGLPLRVIPSNIFGGGYFLTYHGRRTSTGTRRIFYAYLDANGDVIVIMRLQQKQIMKDMALWLLIRFLESHFMLGMQIPILMRNWKCSLP